MAKFVLYEGASDDPMRQTMRVVEGESVNEVWKRYRDGGVLCVQEFIENPALQEPLDPERLKRPRAVWPAA